MNYLMVRKRQKLFLNLCVTLVKICRATKRRKKIQCSDFQRNTGWFPNVWNTFDKERFKAYFKISRETVEFFKNHIEHHLEHDATAEKPIAPKERLAICL